MERHVERLLVIESGGGLSSALRSILDTSRIQITAVEGLHQGLIAIDEERPDLAAVSLQLPAMSGPRVVRLLREHQPAVPIVACSESTTTPEAVAAVRAGASDYLSVPFERARVEQAIGRALRENRANRALTEAKEVMRQRYGFDHILSRSPRMLNVFDQINAVSGTDATVLIRGETGTGKELVARAIHEASQRRNEGFVSVNCGAFAEHLLESELFGHERGSFTGAVGRREGVFEMADKGTLFLDELGQTSIQLQVNLLRVLEEMSFRRVGGERKVSVNVRIVAATNTDLEQQIAEGSFREDLYYRLNVFPIQLPPLRERSEDIPILLRHFLHSAAEEYGLQPPTIAADAMTWICAYHWPGNVRQLRAMCERWVILAKGRTLLKEMVPQAGSLAVERPRGVQLNEHLPMGPQMDRVRSQLEATYLLKVLKKQRGHLQRSAEQAGISRRTLYNKLKEYGIDPDRDLST